MSDPVGKASAAVRYRDLLRGLIATAGRILARDRALSDREVHDLRRLLKRSRSLARLLRFGIGESEYRRLNTGLRSIALPFAPMRDARVLRDAVGALSRLHSSRIPCAAIGQLRGGLKNQSCPLPDNKALSTRLAGLGRSVERLPVQRISERTIDAGVRRVYRRGRRAVAPARLGSDEALHEWRKQVKYLMNQLDSMERPGARVSSMVRELDRLGERLGSDHDLALLAQFVAGAEGGISPHARAAILSALRRRRMRLQAESLDIGARLYRRKPAAFVRRLAARRGE